MPDRQSKMSGTRPGQGAPPYMAEPTLQKAASMRHRSKPPTSSLVPFRDETRLIALPYDQTVAAAPPIPVPPPRSPLRPPPRPSSCVAASNAVGLTPLQLPPRSRVPPPRPPPPTEQHPALRTISTPRSTTEIKRCSYHAPFAFYDSSSDENEGEDADEDEDEDDDPFAYEKIDIVPDVPPLRIRGRVSSPSLYAEAEELQAPRVSEADSRISEPCSSSTSPSLSDGGNTVSPASPATPPPTFTKRFGRALSLRSVTSSKSARSAHSHSHSHSQSRASSQMQMKRLQKKSLGDAAPLPTSMPMTMALQTGDSYGRMTPAAPATATSSSVAGTAFGSGAAPPRVAPNLLPIAPKSPNFSAPYPPSPLMNPRDPPLPPRNATPITDEPLPSPTIETSIPTGSVFEDDFITQLSFTQRGSLLLRGKRPRKYKTMADKDHHHDAAAAAAAARVKDHRSFPLVPSIKRAQVPPAPPAATAAAAANDAASPTSPTSTRSHREESGANHDELQHHRLDTVSMTSADASASASDPRATPRVLPPSIRVISAEVEKESQKVRSLYEFGDGLNWEDGERPPLPLPLPLPGGRLSPHEEVPSDVDENDAHDGRAGPHIHPTLTSASTTSLQDNTTRSIDFARAGGIEDWEGVPAEDVDRYGFISPMRPSTAPRPATSSGSASVTFSRRKNRNVLSRRDAAFHSFGGGLGRVPTRKLSARSLHTQNSEFSTLSRRSTRSVVRQAANLLPHNKDRRLVDEAGDVLAQEPGFTNLAEDETTERVEAELKRKEMSRSEKWRRMAKVVRSGEEGQGMVFEFDPKHPKLVKRTWKGIPDCWRSAAWYSFLVTSAKASSHKEFVTDEAIKAEFHRLLAEASPDDTQIDLDVPRTINQHIMFRRRYRGGQRLLFRVLHSLSLYFPDTGYVQGMAPLAATFLSYYDEETCFVMLVRLWEYRGLNRIYSSNFEDLMGALKDFETYWLGGRDVAEKLAELCIDPTAYATKWYLTLFNLSLPFPVQLRVWDAFILLGSSPPEAEDNTPADGKEAAQGPSSEGLEVLHATSLAIIDALHENLMDSDFENAMKALTSWVPVKDEQKFLDIVQLEYRKHQGRQKKKA
ncbi:rab-GTPase-TBC domain-containing protein [Xylariomycetidae sp. FL0641]|nr:rab-GTPase-TBC domain-containing protein [Xylariomycetidae sp. FL0641]